MTTTPVFTDTNGPTQGTALNAADLNVYVQAISYRLNGGIASSAAGLTVTQPACQAVINPGSAAPVYLNVSATTVPLVSSPTTSQDQYVYLLNTGVYQVVSVNHGGTPTPPATPNLPLYYATTNGTNTAVTGYTDISNTNPIPSQGNFMNTAGSNAGAVSFPSTLAVAGASTFNGVTNNGAQTVAGLATLTGGASMGADIAMANKRVTNAGAIGVGTSSPVGPLHVASVVPATANTGLVSLGSGPFDGTSGGHFVGSGPGTVLALNSPAGYVGTHLDAQLGGVSKFSVNYNGVVTAAGALTASALFATTGANSFAGASTFTGHILGGGSAPTMTLLSGSGTSSSWSAIVPPTDQRGWIQVTNGTGTGASGQIRVTFASAYAATPVVVITPTSPGAVTYQLYVTNVTASQFEVFAAVAPAVSGAFSFTYIVIG